MRAPARTFEEWWELFGAPYEAAVIKRGGTPWTTDMDERRALFLRRHAKPKPPPL
jgi:hypothetical protein